MSWSIKNKKQKSDFRHSLSLVIPIFCNEQSLPELFSCLERVEKQLGELGIYLDLILVDDASTDNSWQHILSLKKRRQNTKIIRIRKNVGATDCCRTGLQFAEGDFFSFLAADLQDPPELIVEMAKLKLSGSDFVACERITRGDPFFTRFSSWLFYHYVRFFIFKTFPKGGFDLMMLNADVISYMTSGSNNIHIQMLIYWLGLEPDIIKYNRVERKFGKSSWTFKRRLYAFLNIIFGYSEVPLRFISLTGFLVSMISVFFGLYILINTLIFGVNVPGYASIIIVIAFTQGIVMLMLGILGEYVIRILEEVKDKRPISYIAEKHL